MTIAQGVTLAQIARQGVPRLVIEEIVQVRSLQERQTIDCFYNDRWVEPHTDFARLVPQTQSATKATTLSVFRPRPKCALSLSQLLHMSVGLSGDHIIDDAAQMLREGNHLVTLTQLEWLAEMQSLGNNVGLSFEGDGAIAFTESNTGTVVAVLMQCGKPKSAAYPISFLDRRQWDSRSRLILNKCDALTIF